MSPITRIALRRIKNAPYQSALLSFALLFSIALLSFFLFLILWVSADGGAAYRDLPFDAFVKSLRASLYIAILLLLLTTLITVRNYSLMRRGELGQTLAVLTSVGAGVGQRCRLLAVELAVLCYPAIFLGIALGALPAVIVAQGIFGTTAKDASWHSFASLALVLLVVGGLLVTLCYYLPALRLKRRAVIQSVRRQNNRAAAERHGYRQSRTFRSMRLLKRLAQKNLDYYREHYRRIALTFAIAAFYPLLTAILFWHIGRVEIVFDHNPYDGVDTSTAVLQAVNQLLAFLGICFLVLTVLGIASAFLMARVQYATRQSARRTYLSIGFTEGEFRSVVRQEIRTLVFWVVGYLFVLAFLANAAFAIYL